MSQADLGRDRGVDKSSALPIEISNPNLYGSLNMNDYSRLDASAQRGADNTVSKQLPDLTLFDSQERGVTERNTVMLNGKEREYFVHTPPNVDPEQPLPVVLVYNGVGSNDVQVGDPTAKGAANMEKISGFSDKADKENFIAVYMQGNPDRNMSWNNKELAFSRTDDVALTNKVLDDVGMNNNIDPAKVYIAGFSEGGSFVNRAINDPALAGTFAAAATVADWQTGKEKMNTADPMSIMTIHANDDPTVPVKGAWNVWPASLFAAMKPQAQEEANDRVRNGITDSPTISPLLNSNGEVVGNVSDSVNPDNGAEVKNLHISAPLGHKWPGLTDEGQTINATDKIWEFFQDKTKIEPAKPAEDVANDPKSLDSAEPLYLKIKDVEPKDFGVDQFAPPSDSDLNLDNNFGNTNTFADSSNNQFFPLDNSASFDYQSGSGGGDFGSLSGGGGGFDSNFD